MRILARAKESRVTVDELRHLALQASESLVVVLVLREIAPLRVDVLPEETIEFGPLNRAKNWRPWGRPEPFRYFRRSPRI